MFGGRRNNNNNDRENLSSVMTPDNPPKKGGGNVTGFDPEGLERAAKAARELDSSRNASSAIELIKTQEVTKQVSSSDFFFLAISGHQQASNGLPQFVSDTHTLSPNSAMHVGICFQRFYW